MSSEGGHTLGHMPNGSLLRVFWSLVTSHGWKEGIAELPLVETADLLQSSPASWIFSFFLKISIDDM